ncbi:MAG TPA: DHA2 family efflux MFS transporter permease subunit [Bosea sp. (in: a-proteobacteria)]|jgi:DHA2 family multidrug resistance protein|uniref:DHA2 family efflux MFS transporter permease subunit n=1 Tax=Bosea sp. (in: a-proteobacteria) TaxID=1871050 RepID=UPI002E125C6D|nr:DHA2 family efflux MFS transporter permease subunit [Bosea sp. (in: a-proteobacteria)]
MATAIQHGAPARPAPAAPSLRALVGVAAALLGTFTSIVNARLTDIGLADIRGALGIGVDEASWIVTAYVVAEVAAIPAAIWLRGILSPGRGVLLGSLLFTLFSLAAPLSRTLETLLALQTLRGLSAGILIPMAYAVIMRHLPQHLRLYGLSLYALISAFTPSVAVAIEAFVLDHFGWQYLFWLNVVPGALTLLAGAYGLSRDPIKYMRFRRPDGFSLLALSFGLAALVAALDQGNRLDWFASGLITGLAAAAALLLGAALVHALLHHDPLVDPRLLWRRNTGLGLFAMFLTRIAVMSSALVLPQYFARVQGYRALESGSVFLVTALPQLLLMPLVAALCYRVDPRWLLMLGAALQGVGLMMMAGLTSQWQANEVLLPLFLQSSAAPFLAIPIMVLITEDISLREIPWIASLVHIMRTVGSAVGVAAVGTFIRVQEQTQSNLLGQHVIAGSPQTGQRLELLTQMLSERLTDAEAATRAATALIARTVQREAFVLAYRDAFLVLALMMFASILVALCFRKTTLPGKLL